MTRILKLLSINLGLFDGAPPAAAPAAAPEGGAGGEPGGTQEQPLNTRKGKKSGGLENVVYGKQPEDDVDGPVAGDTVQQTQTVVTSDTLEERQKRYDELMNGEFKDINTQRTNNLINRRFKDVKTLEETAAKQLSVLEPLMQKYGVNDVDALSGAINEDNSFWEAAADEVGMSVPQYKEFQRLQRENSVFKEQQQQAYVQQQAQQQIQTWVSESETLKALPGYESFDLQTEIDNPRFLGMLKSGVPIKDAYDVMHIDDIVQTTMRQTAQQTEKSVVDNIRARGSSRPAENGVSSQSGIVVKTDASKFTKADRDEIARRVARGENIKL